MPKTRRKTTPSIEEVEEIDMEGWSEIEDDVIIDENSKDAKLSARSIKSLKSLTKEKSPREGKEMKRKRSRDHLLKRQKSKEALSPTKSKASKAKTPDHEHKTNKRGTLKKENTKRKISMKQDPARYDNFLKTSSSYQRKQATKDSGIESSGGRKLRSSSRLNSPSLCKRSYSSTRKQENVNNMSMKKNSTINRSCTSKKVRRKSSVRKTAVKRMVTRSSSSKLQQQQQAANVSSPCKEKPKNLKRSIGRTSFGKTEEKNLEETAPASTKRIRISSLPVPSIQLTSVDDSIDSIDAQMPMSPSPFVFETNSLSNKVGTRVCPLGKRSRLAAPGLIGNFLRDHRAASVSVCSPVQEVEDDTANVFDGKQESLLFMNQTEQIENVPHALLRRKLRRQSNFKMVRLNSIKNKRRSMLRATTKN